MNKEVIVGIDLGTTNSCIAFMDGKEPTVLENTEGNRITPSIVSFKENKTNRGTFETNVGDAAYRQKVSNAKRTVCSIKRDMGTDIHRLADQPNPLNTYLPQEISAFILQYLKGFAQKKLGKPIRKAIITVPAYFNELQRNATIQAAKIAGIDAQLLSEPIASAIAYGLDQKNKKQKILVYDLGGGTFDVSILEIGDKDKDGKTIFKVLATSGDAYLGGDDWDKRIIEWIEKKIKNDIPGWEPNAVALQQITVAAEKAKKELSSSIECDISIPFLTFDPKTASPYNFDANLTRTEFENMCKDLVERTEEPIKKALNQAQLTIADIDEILLVGGSTRMPAIQDVVKKVTGREPNRSINPDEVVAIGAAIKAGIMEEKISDIVLEDTTPLSLGVRSNGGKNTIIIPANTPIPCEKTVKASTSHDFQRNVRIVILQGENIDEATKNKELGQFTLSNIGAEKQGMPEIDITFKLDVNGILTVQAKDAQSGNEKASIITNPCNLSDEEIIKLSKQHGLIKTNADKD